MRLANAGLSSVVESSGVQTTSAFNIARTPHMFNILSSGLYSDKIGAVLREIGCNAMDAHIMGGCPEQPIQVKLPSSLDRSFYVKDWGPGLDDREVRELYTTYGWSNKQGNDDVTGAFGLGSKSPFAYTLQNEDSSDGFTIEAVKDGIRRVYTCYIGEEGAPNISRLHEGPADADWPHGVKVTFPVQMRDINEFHDKAREIFRWFAVQPEILGIDAPLQETNFKFKNDFFALGPESGAGSPSVVMGNVRYPINSGRLRDLSKTETALLGASIHLWVPMGTVMMTPSREELEYTERTRRGVKEWLERAALEVATQVYKDVTTPEPTRWAWYRKIQSYFSTLPYSMQIGLGHFLEAAGMSQEDIKQVLQVVQEKTTAVPKWLGDGMAGPRTAFLRDERGQIVYGPDGPLMDDTLEQRGCRAWFYRRSTLRDAGVVRREIIRGNIHSGGDKFEEVQVGFNSNIKVFYADAKQADSRVRAAVRDGSLEHAILLISCKGTAADYAKEYAERLSSDEVLEGIPTAPASTLEIPAEIEEAKRRRKMAKEQSPREYFAESQVQYLGLNGKLMETTLGELDEGTDAYYLCASNLDSRRKSRFWNGTAFGFAGHNRVDVMTDVTTVATELKLPLTGVVVIPTEAAAKRLKLAEQGFKPFLPWFKEQLENKANWEQLTNGISRVPVVDLREMWRADDFGWLGILGHHKVKATEFWKAFVAEPAVAGLVAEVDAFSAQVAEKSTVNSRFRTQEALLRLAYKVSGLEMDQSSLANKSPYDFKEAFNTRWPSLVVLDESTVTRWMVNEERLTAAVALFRVLLEARLVETEAEVAGTAGASQEDEEPSTASSDLLPVVLPEPATA